LALYRARKAAGAGAGDTVGLRREIQNGIEILVRRQRPAGGIGLWSADDWTSPWLTAHAGTVLLEARDAGFALGDSTVAKIAQYLRESLKRTESVMVYAAYAQSAIEARLTERLSVADFLSRARRRDRALENDLVRQAALLSSESRLTLALVLTRAGDVTGARRLLEPLWRSVKVEGRMATVPDTMVSKFYFRSSVRPAALLLEATLAVDSAHPLVAPLFETVVTRARPRDLWWWNTQDYSAAVRAVNAWLRRFPPGGPPEVRVRLGASVLTARDTTVALTGLVSERGDSVPLQVKLENGRPTSPAYYAVTVTEIPRAVPSRPDYRGIIVERWYEAYEGGKPIVEVGEGELVRVRLKITVPEDRSFVVVDDALPAGLEAVDLSLNGVGLLPGPGTRTTESEEEGEGVGDAEEGDRWDFGSWDGGWWSPFDHRELRDDRVVYAARLLWKGTYSMSYVARATTPGVFVRPPAFAEEMYNAAVYGRTDGGVFTVKVKSP
ncbi:MAG TPA: hypothetical protein VFU23_08080, partial [Gemmatimonadales bacterium]|nr:hypothetical protein [Gemmatimonadales bacterium]